MNELILTYHARSGILRFNDVVTGCLHLFPGRPVKEQLPDEGLRFRSDYALLPGVEDLALVTRGPPADVLVDPDAVGVELPAANSALLQVLLRRRRERVPHGDAGLGRRRWCGRRRLLQRRGHKQGHFSS